MPTELLPVAVLLAIAPGYMTIYFASHGRTGRPLDPDLRLVLQALTISAAILAVLGPPAYAITILNTADSARRAMWAAVWLVAIVLAAPFVVGVVSRRLISSLKKHPEHWAAKTFRFFVPKPIPPTLWDWASLEEIFDSKFIVVEFVDGRKIAGSYGIPGIAMTSPEQHGVYLASEFEIGQNGEPTRAVTASAGVLVPLDRDVRALRIFDFKTKGEVFVGKELETKIAVPDNTKGVIPAQQPAPTQTNTPAPQPSQAPQQQPSQQGGDNSGSK